MFMWTTIVNSLSRVADHPMSSPCWVDGAGPVLEYRTMHLNDVAPASSPMISLLDIIPGMIFLNNEARERSEPFSPWFSKGKKASS